jgi:hypothetical protein
MKLEFSRQSFENNSNVKFALFVSIRMRQKLRKNFGSHVSNVTLNELICTLKNAELMSSVLGGFNDS